LPAGKNKFVTFFSSGAQALTEKLAALDSLPAIQKLPPSTSSGDVFPNVARVDGRLHRFPFSRKLERGRDGKRKGG